MTAPIIALSLPILDALLSILRRFLSGRPIFSADRGHIHHRLLDRGLTPRRAVLLLYAFSSVAAMLSLLHSAFRGGIGGAAVVILFAITVCAAVRVLRYAEFEAARRLLTGGTLREQVQGHVTLARLQRALEAAGTPEQCWPPLRDASRELGFGYVELRVEGTGYQHHETPAGEGCWTVHIPLTGGSSYLELRRPFDGSGPAVVTAFAEVVRKYWPSGNVSRAVDGDPEEIVGAGTERTMATTPVRR